jgi:uncharacterized damage-inducible protein DinB
MTDLRAEFIAQSVFRLEENTPRIKKCLDQLTEEEIWLRPNESSNSIGNLILHLCGNIRQYAVSSISGLEDSRVRDLEFSTTGGPTKAELYEKLSQTVGNAVSTIRSMDEAGLLQVRSVQGFSLSGIGIIIHVTEHYSYHTGQIAFWTKLIKNKDLGFYAGMDLNVKNK